MKKIGKMVHHIEDEMKSAKCYAELFIENKADGNIELANQFRNMAQAEIDHTNFWHQLSVNLIEKVRKVYKPSAEMQSKWDDVHKKYIEEMAEIERMLSM